MSRQYETCGVVFAAIFTRHLGAADWARQRLEADWGPVVCSTAPFEFHHTRYYEPTMGAGLRKQLLAFRDPSPLDALPRLKHHAIALEAELTRTAEFPEARPLNIDPGLLTLGKVLLATTKDQAHRIYLAHGIYAEVTLRFQDGEYVAWPWTYADYREPQVLEFFCETREYLKRCLRRPHVDVSITTE